jgi:hypothetical protein
MTEFGDPRLPAEFWEQVTVAENGCWHFARPATDGYGFIRVDGRTYGAHRFAVLALTGPIPEGMVTDHLCHTNDLTCPGGYFCDHRACVRLDHLEVVTAGENIRRGHDRRRRARAAA